jgi:hypothetical protein
MRLAKYLLEKLGDEALDVVLEELRHSEEEHDVVLCLALVAREKRERRRREMNIEYAWTCKTNLEYGPIKVESSTGGGDYHVSWGPLDPSADTQFGPECSCKGFQFRAECRHVQIMEDQRCGWNSCLEPTIPSEYDSEGDPVCPECSGPVTVYEVLV